MDNELATKIGELIGEVRGINRRLDDVLKDHSHLDARVSSVENRISRAHGAAWAATAIASVLGIDRIVRLFH